ncbi:MAG TPA: hypothetical protein PKC68_06905, partial [Alphaproteobacteria bacterium]|nr:hypothetical protein [Alphaproteobacteria bacterium]
MPPNVRKNVFSKNVIGYRCFLFTIAEVQEITKPQDPRNKKGNIAIALWIRKRFNLFNEQRILVQMILAIGNARFLIKAKI